MFTHRGDIKVMDFGLASPAPRVGPVDSEATTAAGRITQAGAVVGTPAYMSPEQILGGSVDERSDLFSFGIVLHEMLTGLHPFAAPSPMETMAAILREAPSIDPSLASPFAELVTGLLAAKPEQRIGSFEDVLKMLAIPDARVSGAHAPAQQAARIRKERERLVGERRTVTVLVGSIASPHDEEDEEELLALRKDAVATMEGIVGRYEGTLAERREDGVLAVFGAPIAQEDAARRAVAASMEMAARLSGFQAGLHTGPTIVDRIDENLQMSFTPLGDTLRTASRLEAQAEGGEVLVSERTHLGARNFSSSSLSRRPMGLATRTRSSMRRPVAHNSSSMQH